MFPTPIVVVESVAPSITVISSSEVFGSGKVLPMSEDHPRHPTTPYGASKCAGDFYVQAYNLCMGLKSIIIRPFNVYGPRMRMDGYSNVIYKFVMRLIENNPPIIHGTGKQTRDLTYVTDMADGIYIASRDDGLIGHSINIGSGEQTSVITIARMCNQLFDKDMDYLLFDKERFPNDVEIHECDTSRMKERYGWETKIELEDGLKKTIEWMVKNYVI